MRHELHFCWQTNTRPKNISWNHFSTSFSCYVESLVSSRNMISLNSTPETTLKALPLKSLQVTHENFSMDFLLNSFSYNSILTYSGQLRPQIENEYNKQFAMLSIVADDTLLERFRLFQSDLIDKKREEFIVEFIQGCRFAPVVMDGAGKFKCVSVGPDEVTAARRNWVKSIGSFLEDPFEKDPSLPFPCSWGTAYVDLMAASLTKPKAQTFNLSDTRYFNLSELEGFKNFIKNEVFSAKDSNDLKVKLITKSAFVEFIFYEMFESYFCDDDFKKQHIEKWICGYNPYIFFMSQLSKLEGPTVFIDMTKLPKIEVLRFG
jgi:hypothetical protein